jgi:hypothetical protein
MPFVKVVTNLARNQLPAKFLPNVCHKLADVLEKDPSKINWILETDKQMSIVRKIFVVAILLHHDLHGELA